MGAFTTPETQENRVGLLNSLFKEIYADNLENLLPKGLKLQKDIAWIEKSKSPGAKYNQPVLMRHEHGFIYANNSSGAFALEDAVPGQTDTCNILGTQMMLRSIIDYEIAARASSAGKRTFRRALDLVVRTCSLLLVSEWRSTISMVSVLFLSRQTARQLMVRV